MVKYTMGFNEHPKPTESNKEMPLHEYARAVRDATVDMLDFGLFGSDIPIPREDSRQAIPLATLLKYSGGTKQHARKYNRVLNAPREFQIVDEPGDDWTGEKAHGDVYHIKNERSGKSFDDVFIFPHETTSPFISPLTEFLNNQRIRIDTLNINITRSEDKIWSTRYDYFPLSKRTIYDHDYDSVNYEALRHSIGAGVSLTSLERENLLRFTFSPTPLSANDFATGIGFTYAIPFLHPKKSIHSSHGFEILQIAVDSLGLAAEVEKRDRSEKMPGALHTDFSFVSYGLRKEGNKTFGIVNLGTKIIGGKRYFIYSGAEQTPIPQHSINPKGKLFPAEV